MTADLSTVKYKREAVPVIADEQKLKTYFSDELQRVENTLNNHELIVNNVSTEVDGNKGTFDSFVTAQAGVNSASATSVSNLAATVSSGDSTNSAAITSEAAARATADSATTKVVNAQRALLGAAVSDTWESGKTYSGSVNTDSPPAATGDEAVVSGIVYRARQSHNAALANKPPNASFWDAVDTVDAKVAAGVVTASGAHASAGYAAASDLNSLTARVSNVDGIDANGVQQNAGDVFGLSSSIATANSVISTDRDNVSARFGITVPNNYDSAKTYSVGEYTVHNGLLYICIQAATGKIPPTQPLYWTLQTTVAADVAAAITTERTVRVSAEEAIADRTDVVSARIGVPPTGGTNFDSSRQYAIGDEVVHSSGKVYKATAVPPVGTVPTNTSYWAEQSLLSASVAIAAQAAANAQGAVNAKFGVTLDSNGYVSGFESTNNGTVSTFKVAANTFEIRDPTLNTVPFLVSNGVCKMQNVEIGTGVIADNAVSDTHLTTVAQADVVGTSYSTFTEIASLTFTPTSASEILFQGNFMTAALNSSNGFNNFGRADFRVRLELTVGGTTTVIKETGTFLIGLFLHGATTILKEHTSSATTAHTLKLKVRNVNFESSTNKLRCLGITLGATVLYK